jgi:actin related protein 2/3 complex subunit 1A/1B
MSFINANKKTMAKLAEKPRDLFLLNGISVLCFNSDLTKCALSQKDNKIYIYKTPDLFKTSTWELEHTLDAHLLYVSGLDWNHKTNKILSCSFDKTAFVWEFKDNKWIPNNINVDSKLGFISCCWNENGDRLALGTSGNKLFIGYFNDDPSLMWWMCNEIKKIHISSVTTCKISPNSLYCVSGSTDLRIKISYIYLKENQYDNKYTPVQGLEFGNIVVEHKVGAWINSVCWTKDGKYALSANQNSTVTVIELESKKIETLRFKHGPFNLIIPSPDDNGFIGLGNDRNIYHYDLTGKLIRLITKNEGNNMNKFSQGNTNTGISMMRSGGVAEALRKFENAGIKKKESITINSIVNSNLHNTTISSISFKGNDVITTDLAGFVKYWKFK